MDRREFLRASAVGGAGALAVMHLPGDRAVAALAAASGGHAFRHGVAAGDPLPDGVVIWTRVTPNDNAVPGSGIGGDLNVGWEVATDPAFAVVVATGSAVASAASDHTVKVDVRGLLPGVQYYYRFRAQGRFSPSGSARTAPAPGTAVAALRLGLVSCANYEGGYFAAYRHLAAQPDIDYVLHVGDYIYEYPVGAYGPGPSIGRSHEPAHEIVTLSDYRRRHGQYKADPDLQALHARCAWLVTLDDHEVTNDTWSGGAENHQPAEGDFFARRRAALQAYREWMPIRTPDPGDPDRVFRRYQLGSLVDLHLLDLRQYRDKQVSTLPTPGGLGSIDAEAGSPLRTITGQSQMAWLQSGLSIPAATWRLVGNPLMITPVLFPPLPEDVARPVSDMTGLYPPDGVPYNVDQWDGYQADRRSLLSHIALNGIDNVVFVTGDIHSSWACDLPLDPGTYPADPSVAVELVGTSVTSDNLDELLIENGLDARAAREASIGIEEGVKSMNRHIKLLEFRSHGYAVLDITSARLRMDWYLLSDRVDPAATAARGFSAEVLAGSNAVRLTN